MRQEDFTAVLPQRENFKHLKRARNLIAVNVRLISQPLRRSNISIDLRDLTAVNIKVNLIAVNVKDLTAWR